MSRLILAYLDRPLTTLHHCTAMIGARAASVVSDGLVLVLTAVRTFRRVEASAAGVGRVSVLKQVLLRDSECAASMHGDNRCSFIASSCRLLWVSSSSWTSAHTHAHRYHTTRLLCVVNVIGMTTGHLDQVRNISMMLSLNIVAHYYTVDRSHAELGCRVRIRVVHLRLDLSLTACEDLHQSFYGGSLSIYGKALALPLDWNIPPSRWIPPACWPTPTSLSPPGTRQNSPMTTKVGKSN